MTKSTRPEGLPRDDPPSANEDVAKFRLELNHVSLVELEEAGVLDWDRDRHVVTKGSKFDEDWPGIRRVLPG